MRQIVINELSSADVDIIKKYFSKELVSGPIEGVYWLLLPENLLAEAQKGHESCGPFVFSAVVEEDYVAFEMLVRSKDNLHCKCTSYASVEQRQFLLDFFDKVVAETKIKS